MQRLFSPFPGRRAGAALLLLRVAAGGYALFLGATWLGRPGASEGWLFANAAVAAAAGLCLVIGLLTPVSAALAGTATLALLFLAEAGASIATVGFDTAMLVATDALALALIGPGAFSADAALFGRRQIVIPRRKP